MPILIAIKKREKQTKPVALKAKAQGKQLSYKVKYTVFYTCYSPCTGPGPYRSEKWMNKLHLDMYEDSKRRISLW